MANTRTPAGGRTGGRTATPTARTPDAESPAAGLAGSLPDKLRVHALAKLLSVSSKEVIATLAELGVAVRSAQSSIDRDTALRAVEVLLPDPDVDDLDTDQIDTGTDDTDAAAHEMDASGAPGVPLAPVFNPPAPIFLPPTPPPASDDDLSGDDDELASDLEQEGETGPRRRRRRGRRGRGRGKGGEQSAEDTNSEQADGNGQAADQDEADDAEEPSDDAEQQQEPAESGARRRRRRRRRRDGGGDDDSSPRDDDPPDTVVHVRDSRERTPEDEVQAVRGSTRLEAKRQRRRDGREAGRRRAPILSESEFLTRREAVARTMVVREDADRIQIGVLEDDVLVEHFVSTSGSGSLVGNVYLGKVQNVLPSMEAAFVDIGRGRNAVLYAGEVDWDAAGLEGKARRIEQALSSGDSVLVQVTKDPVGHKGARLTTQISLPGRFLVYVPGGRATGISRKLPDSERKRLKEILKRIVPDDAGVIIRTASEGVSEEELARDVRRLQAQWEVIQNRAGAASNGNGGKAKAPELLYEEPDLLVKVVRDLFTEDFRELVVQGENAWDTVEGYVQHVAPDLMPRVRRHPGPSDVFTDFRIDEQIVKALDRKVWLPSGGYLVIDRTEAMTVIDVNTGKFTGSGGNLEETVTRNNLEAAEEIVRQLRLRDIGGIIVIDFIDMVLESNRDLVLRRLTECLGRDRTRHQVAEVTSLGLVQMTRKRVGTGLLEAHSSTCDHCKGRGVLISTEPLSGRSGSAAASAPSGTNGKEAGGSRRSRSARSRGASAEPAPAEQPAAEPAPERPRTSNGVAPTTPVPDTPAAAAQPPAAPAADAQPAGAQAADAAGQAGGAPAAATAATGTETPAAAAAATTETTTPAAASAEAVAPAAAAAGEASAAAVAAELAASVPPQPAVRTTTRRRRAASRPAGPPVTEQSEGGSDLSSPVQQAG